MKIFRDIMAYFRNSAGHNLIETYTQDGSLRFVAWVDLLLETATRATTRSTSSALADS